MIAPTWIFLASVWYFVSLLSLLTFRFTLSKNEHTLPLRGSKPAPTVPGGLFSPQVTGSHTFFLDLTEGPGGPWRLVLGGSERCRPDYVVDRSRYPYHVLEYVAGGQGTAELDGRSFPLRAGTLFSCAPDTRCLLRSSATEPLHKFFFALAGRGVAARLAKAGLQVAACRDLAAHGEIRTVAEDLVREGARGGPLTAEICRTLFELFLLKVSDTSTWADHGSPIARDNFLRCRALIDASPQSYSSLEELAAAAGMDVSSICRLFRRFQGTSPYQYLLRRKMTLAAELLVDQGCLVKEAAQRLGYTDPFHFARCLKAVHGDPPSAVRGLAASE